MADDASIDSTTGYREELYRVFADRGLAAEEAIARALEVGTEHLDVEFGFLTRIEEGTQTVVRSVGTHELLQPGASCPLDRAYCRRTVELDGPLSVQDARASEEIAPLAYDTFELGCYVGSKVLVDDRLFGTVCFADSDPRDGAFTEAEQLFVELLARLGGQALEREAYERELRERNERLREQTRRFQGIAETSFDVIFRVDAGMTFTYVSAASERTLGYSPEELTGEPFTDYLTDSSQAQALAAYERLLGGESTEYLELTFERADGEPVVLEINATPLTTDGTVTGVQGVARDVTARKEREEELRLKNRAIDDAPVGITIADAARPDNPAVYANDGFERITGYSDADLLGRNHRLLQGEATDPETVARLRERVAAQEPVSVELVNYRKDGTPFWNSLTVTPVEDDAGEVTHFIGFLDDITERKRIEQLVRLLNRVLRHNLRNDMNVLLGYSELLDEAVDAHGESVGGRMRERIDRLIDLANDARELERVARGERRPTRIDLESLLRSVASAHRGRYPEATIVLDISTDRAVCAGEELERAVSELVGNALAHDTAPPTRVTVDATDDGEWVRLRVADDGPGISDLEADVVASGQETPLEHGTGLGLWLVNWIVTRYGGSFQIRARDSADATGTVATLRLPAIAPGESVERAARRPTILSR